MLGPARIEFAFRRLGFDIVERLDADRFAHFVDDLEHFLAAHAEPDAGEDAFVAGFQGAEAETVALIGSTESA